VTAIGAGGSGKTRLAIEVARRLLDDFPDGVFFVDLTTVQTAELVSSAIADVLAVKPLPSEAIEAALARHLADKTLLPCSTTSNTCCQQQN
jgi:predicted ATPase